MSGPAADFPVPLRLALVDDDTVMREGLPLLVPTVGTWVTYRDCDELLSARPDVDLILLDLHLHGAGRQGLVEGVGAVRLVVESGYPVCVHTNERRRAVLLGCLLAGARGVVHKAEPLPVLIDAIRRSASGETVMTQAMVGVAELADRREPFPTLTPRQREILAARARGEGYQSIASRMSIARRTAEEHWAAVAAKFTDFLRTHSPADLERLLGLEPGDLHDWNQPHGGS